MTPENIRQAYSNGRKKFRLVAFARLIDATFENIEQEVSANNTVDISFVDKRWEAFIQVHLFLSDPLYNLNGTDSAVQFCTNVLGPVTVVSSNPTIP